jgi:hypothetical protein
LWLPFWCLQKLSYNRHIAFNLNTSSLSTVFYWVLEMFRRCNICFSILLLILRIGLYNNYVYPVLLFYSFAFYSHLHDHIIPIRKEVWAHKTSLTPPHFIVMRVSSQERVWSCIYVLRISILSMFLRFFGWGLELFWQYGNFVFSYYYEKQVTHWWKSIPPISTKQTTTSIH